MGGSSVPIYRQIVLSLEIPSQLDNLADICSREIASPMTICARNYASFGAPRVPNRQLMQAV